MDDTYEYDPKRIVYFGATDSRNKQIPFGIRAIDRTRHMYIIGKTGMGKSTLLENLAIQDIQNGEGLCFIDPHGETADKLLQFVPESRIKDVVYFAPFDTEYPLGFNVMEDVGYDKRHLVVAGLMSSFQRIWVDAWSARMEYILQNTLLALLEYPDTTLIDVNRMLINKEFRAKVVEYVTDPIVKRFWVEEFAGYSDRYTQDATPAIQNKIGQFSSNPLVRNIIAQPQSTFDIRNIMDTQKIFIVNLSKGRMGEQNADLLGSMLTTKIYLSAMSRAEETATALGNLPPFYLYVDEFQSVVNESFANILSEARKYKLSLTIAHQYIEQVEEEIQAAVFGNVGTTIAFRVGPFDAEKLKTVFEPTFFAEDLVNLGFAQIYLSLMIDGIGSKPFSARTLGPVDNPPQSYVEEIIESSRKHYALPRARVEEMIRGVDEKIPPGGFENLNKKRNEQRKNNKKKSGGGNNGNADNEQNAQHQQSKQHQSLQKPKEQEQPKEQHEQSTSSVVVQNQSKPEVPKQQVTHAAPKEQPKPQSQTIQEPKKEEKKDDRQDLRAALADIVRRNEQEKAAKKEQPQPVVPKSRPQSQKELNQPPPQQNETPQPKEQPPTRMPNEVPREVLERVLNGDG